MWEDLAEFEDHPSKDILETVKRNSVFGVGLQELGREHFERYMIVSCYETKDVMSPVKLLGRRLRLNHNISLCLRVSNGRAPQYERVHHRYRFKS